MDELAADLKSGELRPLYVITGSEQLLRRDALAELRVAALAGSPREFNESRFTLREAGMDTVLDACRTFPMMGRYRSVIVQGIDTLKPKEAEALSKYLESPSDFAVLTLVIDSIDLRQKVWKQAQKVGRILKLDPPYQNKLGPWIEARARKKGMGIAGEAATLLGDVIGTDLSGLDEALERLFLYASDPDTKGKVVVTLAHVEGCIARTRTHTVFELSDAMGRRDARAAIRVLESMLEAREPAIKILSMVARHFRRLWETTEALEQGVSPDELATRFRLHPFFIKDLVQQSRLFSHREYAWLLDRFFEVDRLLKSSRVEPDLHLMNLLLDVCQKRAA